MSFVINTNTLSLTAQNNLGQSQKALNTAIERLSSGSKINSAKDDAAGQAISNRMTAQINGLAQASSNANDGISLAQTTEGALNQINDNLQRVRELTVQAANGTNSDTDLDSIQNEINQRLEEINRVSEQTAFNGTNVLDGSKDEISIQVGDKDGQTISINLNKMDAEALNLNTFNVNGKDADGNAQDVTTNPLQALDNALKQVDDFRSDLGAVQNRLDSAINNISTTQINISSAQSRITDADYATEVSNMSKAQILQQAGTSVLAQANQTSQGVLSLLG